jgi:hypothetical protein
VQMLAYASVSSAGPGSFAYGPSEKTSIRENCCFITTNLVALVLSTDLSAHYSTGICYHRQAFY